MEYRKNDLENGNRTRARGSGANRENTRSKYSWGGMLRRLPLLLLIPLALLLPRLAQRSPEFIEKYYARGIYPLISRVLGFFSSLVPFSLSEIVLICVGGALILIFVIRLLKIPFGKLRSRRENRMRFFSFVLSLAIFAGAMLNLFYVLWGFNHYRQPLSTLMELNVHPRPVDELALLTEHLASEAAELRKEVSEDESGVFTAGTRSVSLRAVSEAFRRLGRDNALFSNKCYFAKTPYFAEVLSKLDIAGIYIPYLAEPNVNAEQPDLYLLSGAAHEIGHYYGFAAEEEANFIAYYASLWSEDAAFRYSAAMAALSSCSNKLNSNDSEKYADIWNRCFTEGMKRDLENYREYYKKYENHPAAQVNNSINDAYLQYHGHDDGLRSYGRDVDLLLALYAQGGMGNGGR